MPTPIFPFSSKPERNTQTCASRPKNLGSGGPSRSSRQQIGKNESIPLYNLPSPHRYLRPEHRPRIRKRVELAVFPARIDAARKRPEQFPVKAPSRKPAIELSRIDARQKRRQAARDHIFGQLPRLFPPQRENREHPAARKLLFPVRPNILQ